MKRTLTFIKLSAIGALRFLRLGFKLCVITSVAISVFWILGSLICRLIQKVAPDHVFVIFVGSIAVMLPLMISVCVFDYLDWIQTNWKIAGEIANKKSGE